MLDYKNIFKKYIYFWLDELEFNLEKFSDDVYFYNDLVFNLDSDNTPVWFINLFDMNFTYIKIKVSWFASGLMFLLSIDWKSIPCFALLPWKEIKFKKAVWFSKDKVVLYSSFFVLQNIWKLNFTLEEFVWTLFNYKKATLYRFDICCDLPFTIKELEPLFLAKYKPTSSIWEDKKHPEFYQTYYFWQIQNSNRNSLFRIYDKVLDTWKKHKTFLAPHLENNNDVRRVELEIRPEQAKKYSDYSILSLLSNDKIISSIFLSYINNLIPEKYKQENIELETKKFAKRKMNLKQAYLDFWHIPSNYQVHAYWYIDRILKTCWTKGFLDFFFNQKYNDIFIKILVKSTIEKILNNQNHNFNLEHKTFTNIEFYYEFLDLLILYWKKEKLLKNNKINRILKNHFTPIKTKLINWKVYEI